MAQLVELEVYASHHNIPIMKKEGIEFLCEHIKKEHVKNILEIGSAIGYSAICMALVHEEIHVTTIERNQELYEKAIQNIKAFHLENRITVLLGDALEVPVEGCYDLLFIDAAKSQYIKFFTKFAPFVKPGGFIVSDNLSFHGLVFQPTNGLSRNVRGLVRKLEAYIAFLQGQTNYKTTFYKIGDGISISRKEGSYETGGNS